MTRLDATVENTEENSLWGVLNKRNINWVTLGNYKFSTWYGNAAYFNTLDVNHDYLGYEFSNKLSQLPKSSKKHPQKHLLLHHTANTSSPRANDDFWLDCLHVCQYCFKYTASKTELVNHTANCVHNTAKPTIGKLVYYDEDKFIIRQVRGFQSQLFCQNLALFGKLFLDDKSVYYDIDHFDFYIVYSIDEKNGPNFKPMGFFSKEILSWDNNNNLACICIFPPFQRRHLGWLLIEFLYALAKRTPLQMKSGPEFPLSPYGKICYFKFWSIKLAYTISHTLKNGYGFTLNDLSDITGFRKEDILLTLEYMKLIVKDNEEEYSLRLGNLDKFCETKNINKNDPRVVLNEDFVLI